MFDCPFSHCSSPSNPNDQSLQVHLRLFHRNRTGEIICRLCPFSPVFSRFDVWKRHMKDQHSNITSPPALPPPSFPSHSSPSHSIDDPMDDEAGNEQDFPDIDPSSPYSDSEENPVSFEEMAYSLLSSLHSKLDGLPGVSHSTKDEMFFTIHNLLGLCCEYTPSLPMIDSLMSSFKSKYLRQKKAVSDGLILPQPLHLGATQEQRRDANGQVETVNVNSHAYFVPVEASIRQLLSDPIIFDSVSSPPPLNIHTIERFLDGSIGSSLSQQAASLGAIPLPLTMFEDDAAAGNRNGGVSLRYMIYTVASLPHHLRSSHRCKLLFAVAKAKDMKKYGEDLLQRRWIEEMRGLDTPMEITVNGKSVRFLVRFSEITGDNKALNALCGYRQCFSSGRFCRDCEVDYTELETHTLLSSLQLRTINRYDAAIGQLTNRKEYNGIRSPCVLNLLPGFHVITNVPHDLMHDALEGIARIEIRQVVGALSQQGVTLSMVNDRIRSFCYGRTDRLNKPDQLSLTQVSLGQRAYQMLTLFRLLPWILRGLGDLPLSFLSAARLVSLLLSPRFSRDRDLPLITDLAEQYLQASLNSTPEEEEEEDNEEETQQRRASHIKPKQHFFLHYASSIVKSGPPRLNWSMPYESLLSFAKRVSYASNNYCNLPLTVANAYQRHLHYLRSSPYQEILPICPISSNEFYGLNVRGFEIRKNDFLVISIDLEPSFGKVIKFSRTDSEWNVTLCHYVTEEFVERYNGYKIIETTAMTTFPIQSIYSMQPLDGYGSDESDVITLFPIHSLRLLSYGAKSKKMVHFGSQTDQVDEIFIDFLCTMLIVKRRGECGEEVVYKGECPLQHGCLDDLRLYVAERQRVNMDCVMIEDSYTSIPLSVNERLDPLRGYACMVYESIDRVQSALTIGNEGSRYNEESLFGGRSTDNEESRYEEMRTVKLEHHSRRLPYLHTDNATDMQGREELPSESFANVFDSNAIEETDEADMGIGDTSGLNDIEVIAEREPTSSRKRNIPMSTSLALSGYCLKKELAKATLSEVLKEVKGKDTILREISNGSAFIENPTRRCTLMRAIANFLIMNCRIQFCPSHVEKLAFVTKLLKSHDQFDPITLCQSGGAISKCITYLRRTLAAINQVKTRVYRKSKNSSMESLERQRQRLHDLPITPVGSQGYQSLIEETREYRLILLKSTEFEDVASSNNSLFLDSQIIIRDLSITDGLFDLAKFEVKWREVIAPSLLRIGREREIDLEGLSGICGGREEIMAASIMIDMINRTIKGTSLKGKLNYLFNQFPSQFTQSEAADALKRAHTPYPSIYRIGCQTSLMIYLGDISVPLPSLSIVTALTFIVGVVDLTRLTYPRSLARFYQFFKFLMGIRGSKLHDTLYILHSSIVTLPS